MEKVTPTLQNKVTPTLQEKGILKSLTNNRVKIWVSKNVSEERMRYYMGDTRWQNAMSKKVFEFQKLYF